MRAKGWRIVSVVFVVVQGVVAVGAVAAAPPVLAVTAGGAGEYHPLAPVRVLDTRFGVGGRGVPVGADSSFDVSVVGVGGVPASGVDAVVLNVTVVNPTAGSYLTVWPAGLPRPNASNLNFVAGQVVPNLVTAKVGAGGKVSVYNNAGSTDVIFDVAGWYGTVAAGDGARYTPLPPARILDTRSANGGHNGPVVQDETMTVAVLGRGGVPASGVSAVVVNATVTDTTGNSFLTLFPSGSARPVVSNLNFVPGQTVPNLAVVKLGPGGISAYNWMGSAQVIFDVLGWFGVDGAEPGDVFTALPPARILDTRTSIGNLPGAVGQQPIDVQVTGQGGVPSSGVSAVVVNATATQASADTFVTLWPSGSAMPTASNLNVPAGGTVPNLAVIKLGAGGRLSLFNFAGSSQFILDVVGWYGPPVPDPDPGVRPPPNPEPPTVASPPVTSCSPVASAPALDASVGQSLFAATQFLYSGGSPRQGGVAAGVFSEQNVAYVHGRVVDVGGGGAGGVAVGVVGRPEMGSTTTAADGCFGMVVAGPGPLDLSLVKGGRLPVQREVAALAGTTVMVDDVTLTALDGVSTVVDLGGSAGGPQVHQGSPVTDGNGTRRASLVFEPGTTASMRGPDGTVTPITSGRVRATEFTVGSTGPSAMPGTLPEASGYTYAVEMSLDEAQAAGATEVTFSKPVANYTENFLRFPVGTPVPTGYYDRVLGAWVAAPNGLVVGVVSETGGKADLDVTGDGVADTGAALTGLGITDAERTKVADLYSPGQSLWRVPMTHFTPWDHNWPYGPPDDASEPENGPEQPEDCVCSGSAGGSVIGTESQTLGETLPIQGTPYSLTYTTGRAPGYSPADTLRLPVAGPRLPASVKRIDVTIEIAGRSFKRSYPRAPNQDLTFRWDGLDGFGRKVAGEKPLTWTVSYVYDAVYRAPAAFAQAFARLGGAPISADRTRAEIRLSKTGTVSMGAAPPPASAGPWGIDVHDAYDPATSTLHLGSGGTEKVDRIGDVLVKEAGLGYNQRYVGDGGPATKAYFDRPTALATAPDGSILVADDSAYRARRFVPGGDVSTVAGNGVCCWPLPGFEGTSATSNRNTPNGVAVGSDGTMYLANGGGAVSGPDKSGRVFAVKDGIIRLFAGTVAGAGAGDGGQAKQARLNSPFGLAVGADGSVYIADDLDHRVRKVAPNGVITTVAGTGTAGYDAAEDGGPATAAKLNNPTAVAVLPDGSLLIADTTNDRVRKVAPNGTITTVAGGGSSTAEGVQATTASMDGPRGLTVAPDGTWWVVEVFRNTVRRIAPDGTITTVVNTSRISASTRGQGDGGPAVDARLRGARGITRTADGSLYVSESDYGLVRKVATSGIITTVAGQLVPNDTGDGGQATVAVVRPRAIDVGPDGSRYVVDDDYSDPRVRRIFPDGRIETVAGGAGVGFTGDGGPAVGAKFKEMAGIVVAPDGSFYISDSGNRRVRKVDTGGTISTIAGNGTDATAGDGGPATAAALREPIGLDLGPDGSLYIGDRRGNVVRRVRTDGVISTVAGTGTANGGGETTGPATEVEIRNVKDVAVGPDGSLYIADEFVGVRRVGGDGIIRTIVGGSGYERKEGSLGPETDVRPVSVTVARDGTVFYAELDTLSSELVRRLNPDGRVYTVAGNSQDDPPLPVDPNGSARGTRLPYSYWYDLALDQGGRLLIGEGDQGYLVRVQPSVAGVSATEIAVPRQGELLVFDGAGRHLRTVDTLTGSRTRTFGYDAANRLVSIDDPYSQRTQIQRDPSGRITAFVAPGGQRTAVTTAADGSVTSLADAAGRRTTFTYGTGQLLATMVQPGGGTYRFTYDAGGRLIRDEDPSGAAQQLGRVRDRSGWTVTLRSPIGLDTTYRYEPMGDGGARRTRRDPSGATTTMETDGVTYVSTRLPDNSTIEDRIGADPRFGPAVPQLLSRTRRTPGGRLERTTVERTSSLLQSTDLLSVSRLGTVVTVKGSRAGDAPRPTTTVVDGVARRATETSAEGRVTTREYNTNGRTTREQVAGLVPKVFAYDVRGRPTTTTQGARSLVYTWDGRNRLTSVSDAAGRQERYEYDLADQLTAVVSPGGGRTEYSYDADGYRTSTKLPSGALLGESTDARGLATGFDPPGAGAFAVSRGRDGRIEQRSLPGGRSMALSYDTKGRLTGSSDDTGTTAIAYEATVPNRVASHARTIGTDTQRTAYAYDGQLITSMTMTGPAAASLSYTYGQGFQRTGATLTVGASSTALPVALDRDGAVVTDGGVNIERKAFAAAPTRMGDGGGDTQYTYDGLGRAQTETVRVAGVVRSSSTLTWDPSDRITREVEVVAGATTTTDYAYDADGRLTEVRRNGVVSETHSWDVDGKRTTNGSQYDAIGALVSLGGTGRTVTADGALASRGGDTFSYGPQGELLSATVGGVSVTYGYDARNRMTSRTQGGQTTGFIYGDLAHPDRVSAIVAPGGAVTVLTYDDFGHLTSFQRGGARFYVATDAVGTVRTVFDASGTVVERRRAGAFGDQATSTGPGAALPIGFAGGLADPVTGLVRFGTRDYEPAAGRFTTPDPILLQSGSSDLYDWSGGDPVSARDFDGRDGFASDLADYVVGTVTDLVTGSVADAAKDVAGDVVGKETVETAERVKSVVDDVKEGKNPLADEYKDQLDRSKEQATEGASSLFDPIKKLWTSAANALCGGDSDSESGDKDKADKSKPPKKQNTIKDFDTGKSVNIPSVNTRSFQADY